MGVCASKKPEGIDSRPSELKPKLELPVRTNLSSLEFRQPVYIETTAITICEAVHQPSSQPVVVKRYEKTCKNAKRVKREVEILTSLDHKGLVKLIEYFETENHYFLVFERFDGVPLFEYCTQHSERVSMAMAKLVVRQLAEVLYYLHSNRVIHRNLNLNHILFNGSRVVLIGFQHAKRVESYPLAPASKKGVRKTWTVPYLMAPEAINGRYNHKAEIWTIGVVSYMLLTGIRLFQSSSEDKLLDMVAEANIDWSVLEQREIHPMVIEVLKGMLQKDMNKRVDFNMVVNFPWFSDSAGEHSTDISSRITKGVLSISGQARYYDIIKTMIAEKATEASEEEALGRLFSTQDSKGDMVIYREEAWSAVQLSHVLMNKKDFEALFRHCDKSKSLRINYKDLIKGIEERRVLMRVEELKQLFARCDPDKKGYILLNEFEELLGIQLSNQSVRALFLRHASKSDRIKEEAFIGFTISLVEESQ